MRLPRIHFSRRGSAGLGKLILALAAAGIGTLSLAKATGGRAAMLLPPPPGDTTYYYGPVAKNGTGGNGTTYIDQISISVVAGRMYKLRLVNGNTNGTNRVNSAVTKWNGKEVVSSSNLTSSTPSYETIVAATPTDTIRLTAVGPSGSFVTVSVFSVPDPTYNIFGDSTLNIPTGTSKAYSLTLTVPAGTAGPFRMYVVNGNASGGQRVTGQWIKINGTTITENGDLAAAVGSFTRIPTGLTASNSLNLNLNGPTGSFIRMRITATDTATPALTVIAPAESTTVNATSIPSNGTIADQTPTSVTINGAAATVTNNTAWSATVPLPTTGWQTLTYVATDAGGKARTVLRHIRRVTDPPVLTITAPADNSFTSSATTLVTGTVTGVGTITVNTNGTPLTVNGTAVSGTVPLTYGVNTLVTTANDPSGNSVNVVRTVTRDTLKPVLTVTSPVNNSIATSDSVTVSGTVTDATAVAVTANGIELPVTSGSFSKKIHISAGANTITIVATDQAANSTTVIRAVDFGDVVPVDPSTIAPPLPPTGMAAFIDATSFLYTGANAIQVGVAPGAMDPKRVAVLRGKVFARDGAAIAGARIYILDHPEFGLAHSRSDGRFDIAVNGGSPLVIQYDRSGFLSAQRQVKVPWQDYLAVDSVALVPMDTVATVVDLASSSISVAQSSTVQDADGPRQATVLVKPGTQATMTLADGSTQPLTNLTIRVSEYTVGSQGRAAMPAALPTMTSYTYAAEYGVDEAQAVGATTITFSQPVPLYVDNFLNVPIGTTVPVGSYDRKRAVWQAEENGRVLKILSINAGIATLDVSGSNQAASQAALDSLGINTAELQKLATLYTAGKTLWRARTTHFSTIDMNYGQAPDPAGPPGPPPGANGNGGGPNGPNPGGKPTDNPPVKGPCDKTGSIIECENSILGEQIAIAGTPFTLNYRSDRVPGNRRAYELLIPITADTVPSTLVRADLDVTVAGRTVRATFPPTPNQSYRFVWDGLDAYGRVIRGQQRMTVRVHHIFPMLYYVATTTAKAFGQPCLGEPAQSGILCVIAAQWTRSTEREVVRQYDAIVGSAQPRGLGGWMLSPNHQHDEPAQVIHLGTGERQQVVGYNVARVVAGNGVQGYTGDGSLATSAKLSNPRAVAAAPNGDVYLSEQQGTLIRRFTPGGTISTYAGTVAACSAQPCGDGGPVGQATFSYISALVFGPDGTLFVADSMQHRVRRIDPDGIIRPFAGSGSWCNSSGAQQAGCGDGGPALLAAIHPKSLAIAADGGVLIASAESIWKVRPDGTIMIVAGLSGCSDTSGLPDCGDEGSARQSKVNPRRVVARPDGGYYILNGWANRIRFVDRTGFIHAFAVGGQCGSGNSSCGDGGPALQALFGGTQGAALGPDGSLYVAEGVDGGARIRRIGPDGIVTTFAGIPQATYGPTGSSSPWYGNCPVTVPSLGKSNGWWAVGDGLCTGDVELAVGPDGKMYLTSPATRVLEVAPAISSPSPTEIALASEDGGEVFRFDATGKHLDTRDATTGVVRYTFGYDPNGGLTSIIDPNSQLTTIQRDGSGNPTAIVAPRGQVTSLALDARGYLSRAIGPQNDTTLFTHDTLGMLTSIRDPNGFAHSFVFDSTGRLTLDQNPAGGSTAPVKTIDSTGFSVLQTSAMGRTTQYGVHRQSDGSMVRTVTGHDGLTTTTTAKQYGGVSISEPSGMTMDYSAAPDPVLGLQAMVLSVLNIKSPGGRNFELVIRGGATKDPQNAAKVLARTDTVWVNNRVFITSYDGTLRKYTTTTPMGRQSIAFVDSAGRVTQVQAPGLNSISFTYDSIGRVKLVTSGARSVQYAYDPAGFLQNATDALTRSTSFTYDNSGRVLTQTNPGSAAIGFGYDAGGRLTSVTPPGRSPHTLTYNPVGLLTSYAPPGGVATSASWNADRQLDYSVTPDGDTLRVGYDAGGRPQSLTLPVGSFGVAYHATTGMVTALKATSGDSLKFGYDGVLPTSMNWTGAVSGSVGISYNNDLVPSSVSVNGNQVAAYGYDNDGLLTSAGSLTLIRHPQYGAVTTTTLGSVGTSYGYNGFGEPANQRSTVSGNPIYQVGYTRDNGGRITALADTIQGIVTNWVYTYDTPGRLETVTRNGILVATYGYDSNGNRNQVTTPGGAVGATYDGQDRLLTYGATTYTWSNSGQLQRKVVGTDTTRYTYDVFGNLTRVILGNGTDIQYLVDGQQRRIGKKVNSVLAKGWLYLGQLAPAAELDGSGQVISTFVYGTRVNVPDYMVKGGVTYRLLTDHLGSVRLVVNTATGAVAQRLDYDEWGRVTQNTNPAFQPFGYGGGLFDEQTGLARFGVRDYDSETGRWNALDPAGFGAGAPNLFVAMDGDPINKVDPTGLFPIPDCIKQYLRAFFDGDLLNAVNLEWDIPSYVIGERDGFTYWGNVYLNRGGPRLGSIDGIALIGHEVKHYQEQVKSGNILRWGFLYIIEGELKSLWYFSVEAGYENTATEVRARAMGELIAGNLRKRGIPENVCDCKK